MSTSVMMRFILFYTRSYHVGDSAAWLIGQKGTVKLQTTPHSPAGFALEAGFVSGDEALRHEEINIISNVVGSLYMCIEIGSQSPIAARDTLLLASDGLFDNVRLRVDGTDNKNPRNLMSSAPCYPGL